MEYQGVALLFSGVERFEENLLDLSIHLTNVAGIDVPLALNLRERDNRFRHGGVAAGRTDGSEGVFQHTACGSDVADIPDRDNVIRIKDTAHKCPLDPFK